MKSETSQELISNNVPNKGELFKIEGRKPIEINENQKVVPKQAIEQWRKSTAKLVTWETETPSDAYVNTIESKPTEFEWQHDDFWIRSKSKQKNASVPISKKIENWFESAKSLEPTAK